MTKWAIAAGAVVLLIAALLWKVLESPEKRAEMPPSVIDAGIRAPLADAAPKRAKVRRKTDGSVPSTPGDPVEVMDPKSDEFAQELDNYLLDTFRAEAAPCYKGPLDDRKLIIGFRLRIEDGVVFASDVRVKLSELNDPALERCFLSAVVNKRFSRRDLPNFEEETELFIRLRALKKYRSQEEQTGDAED